MTVERYALRPGYEVSRVIKGGWQLAGGHGAYDRERAIGDMAAFLDAGIECFDCADIYTGVEEMIGEFLHRLRRARGSEAAERVKVHTKLVPDLARLATFTARDVEAIVERSLARLRLERLHLVQFYWWDLTLGRPLEVLDSLARLCEKGKIEHLGVTNWDAAQTEPFLAAGLPVISTQVQYSLLDQRPAGDFTRWCAGHDLAMLCYGTLAGGFLTEAWLGREDPGFAFDNRSLVKYRLIIDEFGPWTLFQDLLRVLADIASRHGVTVGAVAARYVLDQPRVAAVIIGARDARRLPQTLAVFDFALDDAERERISAILARRRGPGGPVYGLERDREGRHGRIMKYDLNT